MDADPNYVKIEKSTSSDSLNKLTTSAAAADSSTANGNSTATSAGDMSSTTAGAKKKPKKGKDNDPYAPTPSQVQAMLDDMLLLESIGIDEVREVDEIILDDGNGEDDEIPMELLDRGEKIKRRNRDMQKKKDGKKDNNYNYILLLLLLLLYYE